MRTNTTTAIMRLNRGVPSPRSEQGSIWTDGDHLFSYATCLAAVDEQRGVIVLNRTKYSTTTSQQQTSVAVWASQQGMSVFRVDGLPRGATPSDVKLAAGLR